MGFATETQNLEPPTGGSQGRLPGVQSPPPPPPPQDELRLSNTIVILQKKTLWFIGF